MIDSAPRVVADKMVYQVDEQYAGASNYSVVGSLLVGYRCARQFRGDYKAWKAGDMVHSDLPGARSTAELLSRCSEPASFNLLSKNLAAGHPRAGKE